MSTISPVRPNFVCCPIGVTRDDQAGGVGGDDGDADPKMALMEDPIVGIDSVVYDESTGPGALAAHPLISTEA